MTREIKYRAWNVEDKTMTYDVQKVHDYQPVVCENFQELIEDDDYILMQYVGKKTNKGRELYEGDIVFVEENEDFGDRHLYLIIFWIEEWSMFASLHMDEYKVYQETGVKNLDESMFWTYTLEHSEENFHYAGNMYENPNLLKK